MSKKIRPELSDKNQYRIERHRYYELKHFCLQYPSWKEACAELDGLGGRPSDVVSISKTNAIGDPTVNCVAERLLYSKKIEMVQRAAKETDAKLTSYIMKGVTEGITYERLKIRFDIPCCRDTYYDLYRRFFWLLHKKRQ